MLEIVSEMLRLSALVGNCGRVITRFIERNFVKNCEGFEVVVQAATVVMDSVLEFAAFVAFAKDETKGAMEYLNHPDVKLDVFGHLATFDISLIVSTATIPESVKGRQKMLEKFAQGFEELVRTHRYCNDKRRLQSLIEMYLGDLAFRRNDDSFRIFNDLVKGVYVEIEKCDRRLVALAAVLNAQVARVVPEGYDMSLGCYDPDQLADIEEGLIAHPEQVAA